MGKSFPWHEEEICLRQAPNPILHVLACSFPDSSPQLCPERVLEEGEKEDSALQGKFWESTKDIYQRLTPRP